MNATKIAKFVVGSFSTAGAAMLVNSVITEHARPKSMKQRISVVAARVVLTALVVETTRRQSDKMIDETIKEWHELKNSWTELKNVLRGEETPEPPSPATGTADN